MKIESHFIVGAATWFAIVGHHPSILASTAGYDDTGAFFLAVPAVLVGSMLPDLDHPGSSIAQVSILKPLAWGARKSFGHRGLLHSLGFALLVVLLSTSVLGGIVGVALAWGYIAHILADYLTLQGVPLLSPLSDEKLSVPGLAVKTGGMGETLYLVGIGILCFVYLMAK